MKQSLAYNPEKENRDICFMAHRRSGSHFLLDVMREHRKEWDLPTAQMRHYEYDHPDLHNISKSYSDFFLLIRDGRDVMVSCYHYYQKLAGMKEAFKKATFREFLYGRVTPGGQDQWPKQNWKMEMFHDPVGYWKRFNEGWVDLIPAIRFEDLKESFPTWPLTGAKPRLGLIGDYRRWFTSRDSDYFIFKTEEIMRRFHYI